MFGAISLGLVVGRHLLELDGRHDAAPERIIDVPRPGIQALAKEPTVG
ncbi:MAG TPA: hypothetical protein VG756_17770 [Pseudonocardiaceae bacterium]|nr:hypothetical protein [Pseudonocardiaceae bacterium]